jgi:hypothetical protein
MVTFRFKLIRHETTSSSHFIYFRVHDTKIKLQCGELIRETINLVSFKQDIPMQYTRKHKGPTI